MATKNALPPNSQWISSNINIDGNNNDWQLPYPFVDKDNKVQYAFANNRNTLFITLKTSDAVSARKLERGGFTIYIDTNGKKTDSIALTAFMSKPAPDNEEDDEPTNSMASYTDTTRKAPRRKHSSVVNYPIASITLKGFKRDNNGSIQNPAGIIIGAGVNDFNETVWEIAIPFSAFYKRQIDSNDQNRKMNVCFYMAGLSEIDMPAYPTTIATTDIASMHNQTDNSIQNEHKGKELRPEHDDDYTPPVDIAADRERLIKNVHIWHSVRFSYK